MLGEVVVVFDTNVLIPLSIPASRSNRLLGRLNAVGYKVAVTPQILAEVRDKMYHKPELRKWLNLSDEKIARFLKRLSTLTIQVQGTEYLHGVVKADHDDDKIIAAAVESGAEYIVSQDRHLLDLGEWGGIKIMNVQGFNQELDRLGVPTLSRLTKKNRRRAG